MPPDVVNPPTLARQPTPASAGYRHPIRAGLARYCPRSPTAQHDAPDRLLGHYLYTACAAVDLLYP